MFSGNRHRLNNHELRIQHLEDEHEKRIKKMKIE